MKRISTLNINGIGNYKDKLEYILSHNDDIIVLTEYRETNDMEGFFDLIESKGYKYIYYNKNLSNLKVIYGAKRSINSVLVISKIELNNVTELDIEGHKERVLRLEYGDTDIYAVYFPQEKKKEIVFDYLIAEIQERKRVAIIIGDLQTGDNILDKSPNGALFYCSDKLKELIDIGLKDAFRIINGEVFEGSWASHKNNEFRIDHILVDKSLTDKVKYCEYIHYPREKKYTDHSMMKIAIDF